MKPASLVKGYGKILKDLRKKKNISQRLVGMEVGVSGATISNIENENSRVEYGMISKLMALYGEPVTTVVVGRVPKDMRQVLLTESRVGNSDPYKYVDKDPVSKARQSLEDRLELVERFKNVVASMSKNPLDLLDEVGIDRSTMFAFIQCKPILPTAMRAIESYTSTIEATERDKTTEVLEDMITPNIIDMDTNIEESNINVDESPITPTDNLIEKMCVVEAPPEIDRSMYVYKNGYIDYEKIASDIDLFAVHDCKQILMMMDPHRVTLSICKIMAKNRFFEMGGTMKSDRRAHSIINGYTMTLMRRLIKNL